MPAMPRRARARAHDGLCDAPAFLCAPLLSTDLAIDLGTANTLIYGA